MWTIPKYRKILEKSFLARNTQRQPHLHVMCLLVFYLYYLNNFHATILVAI